MKTSDPIKRYAPLNKTLVFLQSRISRNQSGLASVVVVSVLVVVLSLISIGFSRDMDRAVRQSANSSLGTAAIYAARSGINDAISYVKANPAATASNCGDILTDNSLDTAKILANLSGDGSTKYTCLLINPTPTDLAYQKINSFKSQVVRINPTANLSKLMFSWQAYDQSIAAFPAVGSSSLMDETTWGTNKYQPILRLSLYAVPTAVSGSAALQYLADPTNPAYKTFFFYPNAVASASPSVTEISWSLGDGSLQNVNCADVHSVTFNTGTFSGSADNNCNIIINNLPNTVGYAPYYYYARITPLYTDASVIIKGNDASNKAVQLVNTQAIVDVTAKSGPATKRLQARVNIDSNNISASDDVFPEYAVRSASALCKRLVSVTTPYNFVWVDGPPTICNPQGTVINNPVPTLALSINNVDSAAQTPGGSSYTGVSYIDASGSATVRWTSTDAGFSCNATGGSPGWTGDKNSSSSWSGSTGTGSQTFNGLTSKTDYSMLCKGLGGETPTKTVTAWPPPTANISDPGPVQAGNSFTITWSANNATQCQFSGNWSPAISPISNPTGAPISGSQTISTDWDDTSARSYTIICHDPSSPNRVTTYTRNLVVTWPTPTPSISGPASITAGNSLTLSWSVGNSSSCSSSGWPTPISLSGLKGQSRSGSQTISTNWNDNGTQTYTITCSNPANTKSVTWTVGVGGNTNKTPPPCTADWNVVDHGDGTGTLSWNGSCPAIPTANTFYNFTDCTTAEMRAATSNCGGVGGGRTLTVGVGRYCGTFHAGGGVWGTIKNSAYKCFDVVAPPVHVTISQPKSNQIDLNFFYSAGGYRQYIPDYDFSWFTRVDPPTQNDCRDFVHKYVACFNIDADQGGNPSKIDRCVVSPPGSTIRNERGQPHWSSQGRWITVTVGWDSKPADQIITVECWGKDGGVSGSATPQTVHWKTCTERGQTGTYYTDVARNGCKNPEAPPLVFSPTPPPDTIPTPPPQPPQWWEVPWWWWL